MIREKLKVMIKDNHRSKWIKAIQSLIAYCPILEFDLK